MSQEVVSSTKKKEATCEDIQQDLVKLCDFFGVRIHFLFNLLVSDKQKSACETQV